MQDTDVKLYPLLSQAHRLLDDGNLDQAAQAFIGHLRQYPDDPKGLAGLGKAAMLIGALVQAEQFLRKAMIKGANDLETRRLLASVINQQERLSEAEGLFDRLAKDSGETTFQGIRANILDKLGRNEEALAIYEQLVAADPDSISAWVALGHARRAAGNVEGAEQAYRKAIGIDHEFGDAWWGLASIKQRLFSDDDVAAMQRALSIAVDERNTAPLNFALARAFHDRKDHDTAFKHYAAGNLIRADSLQYNAQELTDEIDEVMRMVDPAYMARMPQAQPGGTTPVFIVSLPRSGSTLLEQMLTSHPQVEAVGELPYIPAILRSFMEVATRKSPATMLQAITHVPPDFAARMGQDYLQRVSHHRKSDAPYFIDKLPHNWSNLLFIRKILPNARFVDIRRPAMDCCFSNFTQSFTRSHASSFALKDIGQCYSDYVRFMRHLDAVAPGLVDHVNYSMLVADPTAQLKPLFTSLGLEWDDRVLEFHKTDRVVRTPSSEQVRRPLNRDGMEVWRPYAQWLDPLRDALGDLAEA